jgi:HlyD family secretion protein
MSKSLKWVAGIIVASFVLLLLYNKVNKGTPVEKVATEKVVKRTIVETVAASGKIYPESEVKIIPEFSGKLQDLKVAEGDSVKKGQFLANVGGRSSLTSPISGTVLSLSVKEGENVTGNSFNTGMEVMTIADMSVLEVRTEVGENDVIKIHKGDSSEIEVDAYAGKKIKGIVVSIANNVKATGPLASQNDLTSYEVRIKLLADSYKDLQQQFAVPFRPGMNARVAIKTQRKEKVLSVPIISVNARTATNDKSKEEIKDEEDTTIKNQLEEIVFVKMADGTLKKVNVIAGIQDMDYIEIVKGLQEGDEVVTGPYSAISQRLKSGVKVKVVPKEKLFDK